VKRLRQIHLYLGCIFAPMVIAFAVSGALQMFGVRLPVLTQAHTRGFGSLPFMVMAALMGLSLAVTSILGVIMAFRFGAKRRNVWASLIFGTLVPLILLGIVHYKESRPIKAPALPLPERSAKPQAQ
jgi:hypothetical protein